MDHSLAFEQYQAGAIEKEALANHPNQQLLTRAITAQKSFAIVDYMELSLANDDVYVICSDGVNKLFTDAELATLADDHLHDPGAGAQAFVDEVGSEAVRRRLVDDLTLVVFGEQGA